MATNPKSVTVYGRLSFPRFTMAEAIKGNEGSKFPKKDADIAPEFNLLLEQAQLDKLIKHIDDVFLPYVEAQAAAKEKRDALDPKSVKKVRDFLAAGDWSDQPPFMPIKPVHEKTQPLAPEAVASLKITGPKGADVTLKATVYEEGQLLVPDPDDLLPYPKIKPIEETVFQMYPGAYVAATLNLFAFFSSNSIYGISAGANTAVYRGNLEGERFGGGVDIDEDAIFLDD